MYKTMSCRRKYENWIENLFGKYGEFVAKDNRNPWIILFICVLVNLGLTMGLVRIEPLSDIEELYTPENVEASRNRREVKELFKNKDGLCFNQHALSDIGQYGEIIFRTEDNANIINSSKIDRIKVIDERIRNNIIVSNNAGKEIKFSDLCAKFYSSGCVVDGDMIFSSQFRASIGNISYPDFQNRRIAHIFGNVEVEGGILKKATMLKFRYNLRDDQFASISKKWEREFEEMVSSISEPGLEIAFIHSNSRNTELDLNTSDDLKRFVISFSLISFALMMMYASFASVGLNMNLVAWRPLLSLGGVLATILAIGSALGFTSLIGIRFVSLVGAMPFLVVGIGLDDVFILMSGVADAFPNPCVGPKGNNLITHKMFLTLKSSGIAITITSLTNVLAFGIGASSVFLSVRNFCITTGVAVLFCYLNQLFFFVPCLVINERRVEENRHFFCCHKRLKSKDEDKEIRSVCSILCCSGHKPEKRDEFDGLLEKFPKLIIKAIIRHLPNRMIVLILFLIYIGFSIYGSKNLKQGLELKDLATTDSYYYKFTSWNGEYFREDIPITFVFRSEINYSSNSNRNEIKLLLKKAKRDQNIIPEFEISWLRSYENSPFFNATDESSFISSLQLFLNTTYGSVFKTDLEFDDKDSTILASRVYVLSNNVKHSLEQGDLMLRMRQIALESNLPGFAYSPAFILFEQYVHILPATFQTVGIAVAAMFVITVVFMPQPIMVFLVILTMVMILLGIFGFMYFWDLTLSSITMVHLIMTVGFSVDFSAHICHAYLSVSVFETYTKGKSERQERVEKAIDRSGGPIINAALSSIIGILMLGLSTSYIFQSFFKLMLMVILFGLAHSILLLPILLLFIGPQHPVEKELQSLHEHVFMYSKEILTSESLDRCSSEILSNGFEKDEISIISSQFNYSYDCINQNSKYELSSFADFNNLYQFVYHNERKTAKMIYDPDLHVFIYRYS